MQPYDLNSSTPPSYSLLPAPTPNYNNQYSYNPESTYLGGSSLPYSTTSNTPITQHNVVISQLTQLATSNKRSLDTATTVINTNFHDINKIQKELKKHKTIHQIMQLQVESMGDEIHSVSNQYASEISDIKSKIDHLECDIATLKRSIKESLEEIMPLCFENSRKLADYTVSQDSQRNINSTLTSLYNENKSQIQDLTKKIQELDKKRTIELSTAHQQKTAINHHASEIKKNKQTLNKLNEKLSSYKLEIIELKQQIQEFIEKQKTTNKNNNEKQKNTYQDLEKENKVLKKNTNKLTNNIQQLMKKLEAMESQHEIETNQQRKDINQNKKLIEEMKKELTQQQQLSYINQENSNLLYKKTTSLEKKLTASVIALNGIIQENQESINKFYSTLEKEIEEIHTVCDTTKKLVKDLNSRIKTLEETSDSNQNENSMTNQDSFKI